MAALIDAGSVDRATGALRGMDDFYDAGEPETVTVRLAEALISPSVSDPRVLDDLPRYRNLDRSVARLVNGRGAVSEAWGRGYDDDIPQC
ncbi:hypothetical protein QP028_07010 [Corynebacterium suedekumii]|nr:hypothetical protein QP028_07010 [Corynebacterium suedekumii]